MNFGERREDGSAARRRGSIGRTGATFAGKGILRDEFFTADIAEVAAHPVREDLAEDRSVGFMAALMCTSVYFAVSVHIID